MIARHYDVVVLGTGLGALAAAALLARRGWRLLVLGQGRRPPTYAAFGHTLHRRARPLLAATSSAFGRLLAELAQSQLVRRRLTPLDPMFQVLGPGRRLSAPPDAEAFARELEREHEGGRRLVDDTYLKLAEANGAADAALARNVVVPPGTFWERREAARALDGLDAAVTGLEDIGPSHPFADVVDATVRFSADLSGAVPAVARARLHGAWTRGPLALEGGETELEAFFVERVRAHGGEVQLGERAAELVVKGGKVAGVVLEGTGDTVGASFALTSGTHDDLLALLGASAPPRRADAREVRARVRERRFVVTAVVDELGLPPALGREAFVLGARPGAPGLVDLRLSRVRGSEPGTAALVAETLVREGEPLRRLRERVLATLADALPFVERHVVLVDSPHDGEPLWQYGDGAGGARAPAAVDRARLRAQGVAVGAEPMDALYDLTGGGEGLRGEALRGPVPGTLVVGPASVPALGQEGELVAAWGAARIVTRTDRRKEKMLRELWSKMELA